MEKHPATGITLYDRMGYDCESNCPIPRIIPENLQVMDIIGRFGSLLYDGETIHAMAIEKVCDWSNIVASDRWFIAQKIAAYYSTIRQQQHAEITKDTAKPTPKPRAKRKPKDG